MSGSWRFGSSPWPKQGGGISNRWMTASLSCWIGPNNAGYPNTQKIQNSSYRMRNTRFYWMRCGVIPKTAEGCRRRRRPARSDLCAVELSLTYQAVSAFEPHPRRCPLCLHKWREHLWHLCHCRLGRGRGHSLFRPCCSQGWQSCPKLISRGLPCGITILQFGVMAPALPTLGEDGSLLCHARRLVPVV